MHESGALFYDLTYRSSLSALLIHGFPMRACRWRRSIAATSPSRAAGVWLTNRKPSGQPYLTPEESLPHAGPAGFEIKVFAAEPDIINPIAAMVMTRRTLGRRMLRVSVANRLAKCRESHQDSQDTDGDGKADKVTLWAEGRICRASTWPAASKSAMASLSGRCLT